MHIRKKNVLQSHIRVIIPAQPLSWQGRERDVAKTSSPEKRIRDKHRNN